MHPVLHRTRSGSRNHVRREDRRERRKKRGRSPTESDPAGFMSSPSVLGSLVDPEFPDEQATAASGASDQASIPLSLPPSDPGEGKRRPNESQRSRDTGDPKCSPRSSANCA